MQVCPLSLPECGIPTPAPLPCLCASSASRPSKFKAQNPSPTPSPYMRYCWLPLPATHSVARWPWRNRAEKRLYHRPATKGLGFLPVPHLRRAHVAAPAWHRALPPFYNFVRVQTYVRFLTQHKNPQRPVQYRVLRTETFKTDFFFIST